MEKQIKNFINNKDQKEIFFGFKGGVVRLLKDGEAYMLVDYLMNGNNDFINAMNINIEDVNEIIIARMVKLFIEY